MEVADFQALVWVKNTQSDIKAYMKAEFDVSNTFAKIYIFAGI